MGTTIEKAILALVVIDKEKIIPGGGAPVFLAKSKEEQQKTAFFLEKILDGMAHDLENEIIIIVRH